jgi:hypothetical protein
VSALDVQGRTIWIADAHRDEEKRFVVDAVEKLTACLELQANGRRLASAKGQSEICVNNHKKTRTLCLRFVAQKLSLGFLSSLAVCDLLPIQ